MKRQKQKLGQREKDKKRQSRVRAIRRKMKSQKQN